MACAADERQLRADAHVAVLFSGGIDCTVLAALASRFVPHGQRIDLLNVAFENPRVVAAAGDGRDPYEVPDRGTARASLVDLRRTAPERDWALVEINVSYAEYRAHLDDITTLLRPSDSMMDLSIAAALYFASRGRGRVLGVEYTSTARVLISGLGADELLGGYGRHRQAFSRGGHAALIAELQLDLDRIPTRNLGRDDRIISAQAKEARYPFLARSVVEQLCALPISFKVGLDGPFADKQILRDLAGSLGLTHAAALPKRAIQFGARSAKLDALNARAKGTERIHAP